MCLIKSNSTVCISNVTFLVCVFVCFMCLGRRLAPLSEIDFSVFLLKLDVTDGSVFAGVACLAHENCEEVSNSQNEFSWWGTFVQHLTLLVVM